MINDINVRGLYNKYPVSNVHWRRMDQPNLWQYLHSFNLESTWRNLNVLRYQGITTWFLRQAYCYEYVVDPGVAYASELYKFKTIDPWNRQFPAFPYDKRGQRNQYMYDGVYDTVRQEYVLCNYHKY